MERFLGTPKHKRGGIRPGGEGRKRSYARHRFSLHLAELLGSRLLAATTQLCLCRADDRRFKFSRARRKSSSTGMGFDDPTRCESNSFRPLVAFRLSRFGAVPIGVAIE